MKAKSIFRFVLFFLTLLACGIPANAQVEYRPEMEKFLGDWIHPRNYYECEYFVRITKKGDFVSLKMKGRDCEQVLKYYDLKDEYFYTEFSSIRFTDDTFYMQERNDALKKEDISVSWKIVFDKGNLRLYRIARINSENYQNVQEFMLYPKESDW